MIDLNELSEIASQYDAKKNEKLLIDNFKKYEKYIDDRLLEKAKNGERTLVINFNIKNFVDFHSVMVNYFNYKNHRYNVEAVASDDSVDYFLSDNLLNEFTDFVSKCEDKQFYAFVNNNKSFNDFTLKFINCVIRNIKMTIKF